MCLWCNIGDFRLYLRQLDNIIGLCEFLVDLTLPRSACFFLCVCIFLIFKLTSFERKTSSLRKHLSGL